MAETPVPKGVGGLVKTAVRSYLPPPQRRKASLIPSARKCIAVDWNLNEATWRAAGRAFQQYVARRRSQRDSGPRRILADFLIGAHALHRGFRLLTLDDRLYRAAFPRFVALRV